MKKKFYSLLIVQLVIYVHISVAYWCLPAEFNTLKMSFFPHCFPFFRKTRKNIQLKFSLRFCECQFVINMNYLIFLPLFLSIICKTFFFNFTINKNDDVEPSFMELFHWIITCLRANFSHSASIEFILIFSNKHHYNCKINIKCKNSL